MDTNVESGDVFKRASDVLKGVKMAERSAKRIREGRCDWGKGEDVAFMESVDRAGKQGRPKDGKCRNCFEYVEGRWVFDCPGAPMCWSCFLAGGGVRGKPVASIVLGLDGVLEGEVVRLGREMRCWSRATLGKKVGKSGSWVQKIEDGKMVLSGVLAEKICLVLSEG